MEQIPETRGSEVGAYLALEHDGSFGLSISHAGSFTRNYPLSKIASTLASIMMADFPRLGLWIFTKDGRRSKLESLCSTSIAKFAQSIKMELADSIFTMGADK